MLKGITPSNHPRSQFTSFFNSMKTIIVGMGEVGYSLATVLAPYYDQETYDFGGVEPKLGETFEIMHICFPYSEKFEDYVKAYQERFEPKYTVVHSTTPVGTCARLGVIHSPIRGIHPHLTEGIKTFVKFIGGPQASEVADYFRRAGLKVCLYDKSETTEAAKLFDTEYYRTCIEFAQRVKKFADSHGLSYHEVYTIFNQTYNEGYTYLNHPEFVRPVLQPIMGPIGGHCVLPNKQLIETNV